MNKAVSPLVASVLLIAVTMTIAGVLAYWASGFFRERTVAFSNQTVILQQCTGGNFNIYSSSYNSTSKNATLLLENKGDVVLTLLEVDYIYSDGTIEKHDVNMSLPVSAALKSLAVQNVTSGFTKFRVATNCPDTYKEMTA